MAVSEILNPDDDENRLVRWIVARATSRPLRTLGYWLVAAFVGSWGTSLLSVETSTESVLDRSGPEWTLYQKSTELFGTDEDIVVAFSGSRSFDSAAIAVLSRLSRELGRLQGVRRVDSLASTAIVLKGRDGEIIYSAPFSPDLLAVSVPGLNTQILQSEVAREMLVSADGRTFAIRLRLEDPLRTDVARLTAEIEQIVGHQKAWISGVPIFRAGTGLYTQREVRTFVPLTVVVISLILGAFFVSVTAVLVALAVGGVGTLIVLGTMGFIGVPLSLSAAILPSVLLAMGCASATHLLSEVKAPSTAIDLKFAAAEVARPILLAGAVTALAFLTGAFVPIEAIRVVGVFGAMGALVVALATVSFGTATLTLWTVHRKDHRSRPWAKVTATFLVSQATSRSWLILGVWLVVAAIAAVGVRNIQVETDVTNWFPRTGEVRQSYDAISSRLAGISPMNIVIESHTGASVTEPVVVAAIDRLTHYMESLPDVGRALSIGSLLREVHRLLDRESSEGLPTSRALMEQYLLFLQSSEGLWEFVSDDRLAASIAIRANNNGSEHLLAIAEDARRWWAANGVDGYSATCTGIMFEFARAEREITSGQLSGLGLDVLALLALYLFLFRSVRLSMTALVPTGITVLATFGVLGWTGAALDAGTVFVGTLAVGVTVDETLHMVNACARAMKSGEDVPMVLQQALRRLLPALLVTTVALASGFMALALSDFTFTRRLGVMTALAMAICAGANATLLPALLSLQGGHVSLPRFRGYAGSHKSAVGVCHGRVEASIVHGDLQDGGGGARSQERQEHRGGGERTRSHGDSAVGGGTSGRGGLRPRAGGRADDGGARGSGAAAATREDAGDG